MDFRPTFAIMLRQWYLIRGSFTRVLPLFVWVSIDILLWGFMTRYLNNFTGHAVNFVFSLLGAVLLWDFLVRVMQGIAMALLEDVWSHNFLNLFSSPLTVTDYISGLILTSIATTMVGLSIMLLLATGVFGLSFFSYGLALIPFLLILFMFGIALGIFSCGIVLKLGPAAEWFVWPITAIISPFVGVFYPLSTLPKTMQLVARALPPSYVFENIRAIAAGHGVNVMGLATGIALGVLYIGAAIWFFLAVFRHALKTGILARYSAESL